jgi:hypothetical protein
VNAITATNYLGVLSKASCSNKSPWRITFTTAPPFHNPRSPSCQENVSTSANDESLQLETMVCFGVPTMIITSQMDVTNTVTSSSQTSKLIILYLHLCRLLSTFLLPSPLQHLSCQISIPPKSTSILKYLHLRYTQHPQCSPQRLKPPL